MYIMYYVHTYIYDRVQDQGQKNMIHEVEIHTAQTINL